MNLALWKKNVRESRLLFLCSAGLLFVFCWVRVWITGQLDMNRFRSILESLPASWLKLSPVPIDQLLTYHGRIAIIYEEPLVYLMMAVWSIARASDCVSGALHRGTMELLAAQPVSRLRILLTHSLVTLLGVGLLATAAHLGTWTGIATTSVHRDPQRWTLPLVGFKVPLPIQSPPRQIPMSQLVTPEAFLPAALNYASLGTFLTGLTTLLSSWDRYRWRTIGLAVAVYVVQTIFELVGLAVAGMEWMRRLTFFTAYDPIAFVGRSVQVPGAAWALLRFDEQHRWVDLGPVGYDLILVGLGLAGIAAAAIIFCRRDLPAPV
jgi:ABC-2 type transport system permease protein